MFVLTLENVKTVSCTNDFWFFRQKFRTKEDVPNQYTITGDIIFSRANNFRFLNTNLDQTARSMFQMKSVSYLR